MQYIDVSAWKVTSSTPERQKPEKVLIYTVGSWLFRNRLTPNRLSKYIFHCSK